MSVLAQLESVPGELLYGGLLCAVGLVLLGIGLRKPQPAIRVLRRDPLSVGDLSTQAGAVEVRGPATVDDGRTVETPFTQTRCLAYEYEVQELQSSGQHSHWETLDEGGAAVPFVLEDETGRVRVDPTGATLAFEEHTLRVRPGDELPERVERFVREREGVDRETGSIDLLITEIDHGDDQRFVERRLDVGETAHIYGGVEQGEGGEWGSSLVGVRITGDDRTGTYVISDSTERRVAWHAGKRALAPIALGLAALCVGIGIAALAVL